MRDDDDDWELSEDDWEIIKSVVNPQKMTIAEALKADDPLFHIGNNMKQNTKEQKLFALMHAAILEVSSSGVAVLFERFTKEEIDKMYDNYRALGAKKFCDAIDALKRFLKRTLGQSHKNSDILNRFNNDEFNEIDRILTMQSKNMCEEMEKKLLIFVKQNIAKLENRR